MRQFRGPVSGGWGGGGVSFGVRVGQFRGMGWAASVGNVGFRMLQADYYTRVIRLELLLLYDWNYYCYYEYFQYD